MPQQNRDNGEVSGFVLRLLELCQSWAVMVEAAVQVWEQAENIALSSAPLPPSSPVEIWDERASSGKAQWCWRELLESRLLALPPSPHPSYLLASLGSCDLAMAAELPGCAAQGSQLLPTIVLDRPLSCSVGRSFKLESWIVFLC